MCTLCVPEYLFESLESCKALRPPGTGACKLPEVGSRNWTQDLCESTKCSELPNNVFSQIQKLYREGVSFIGINCIPRKNVLKGGMFVPCIMHWFSPSTQNLSEEKKDVSRDETGMIIEKAGHIKKKRKKKWKTYNGEECI